MRLTTFFTTIVLLVLLYSCGNNKSAKGQKNDSLEVTKTEQVANEQSQQVNTPEKVLNKEDIKSIVLDTLKIDSEDYDMFFSDIKTSENETIMAVGGGSYEEREDIFVVICDNFGNIKSKYTYTKEVSAEHISGIKVMDTPYNVKDNAQLIGVLISRSHQGHSSSLAKEVSLFIVEDEKIRPILEDCITYYESSIVKSTTEILPDFTSKSTNGFYDLKLTTTEFDMDEESGSKIDSTKVEKIMFMNSGNGKYKYKQTSTQQLPELTEEEKAVVYKYFSEEEIKKGMEDAKRILCVADESIGSANIINYDDLFEKEGFALSPDELEKKWGKAKSREIETSELDIEEVKITSATMEFDQFKIDLLDGGPYGWGILSFETATRGFGFGGVYVGVPECNKAYLLQLFEKFEVSENQGNNRLNITLNGNEYYRGISIELDENELVKSISYTASPGF